MISSTNMVEDASSKKFLVTTLTNYKMTDSRPVLEQYNEILDFKHTLKHLKEELTLVELGSHLRIEESLRVQDSDKPKGNNVFGPSFVNMVEHNNFSRDSIFNEKRFSSVPRLSLRIPNGTEEIGGLVVPKDVTEEVVQKHEHELRKGKRNRTPKNFGPEFQLYLIKGTRDEVSDQHPYCFNVEDDPKTFDEAMKTHDVAFWKEAIIDEMDYIMGNNTWVLADLPPVAHINTIRLLIAMALIHNMIIHYMDMKTAFLNGKLDEKVDLTKEFLSSRFFMKDMREADVILVSTPMDTSEKRMPNNGQAVSQHKYFRVFGWPMYAMTCTRLNIAFAVRKLSSAATLAKAYSQMYNVKSRHLGVRHRMIRELITNGVISIEFVSSMGFPKESDIQLTANEEVSDMDITNALNNRCAHQQDYQPLVHFIVGTIEG
nr:zinc finger, CCHC-type [Tanacetum cinerariifolium]